MKTNTSALVAAAALAASLAHGAIVPDADTILYVNCETAYGFGQNLATAADKLVNVDHKNDGTVLAQNAASPYVRDGVGGAATANGGYLYSSSSGPVAKWAADNYTDGDFTYEMFFRLDVDTNPGNGDWDYPYLVEQEGESSWKFQWYKNQLYVLNKWSGVWTSPTLNDGLWHHIAIVQDKDGGTISVYFDYTLVATKTATVESGASSGNLIIGAQKWDGRYMTKCAYDEIRIVKRALAPTEFLFQRTMPVDVDTAAYMSFNSTKDAKYDIDLGPDALGVVQGKWNSYTSGISGSDAAAATLYPEARAQYGFTDAASCPSAAGTTGMEASAIRFPIKTPAS